MEKPSYMEPEITINGHKVTEAMAMTIRVAIESFSLSLVNEPLGNDAAGERMTKAYMDRIIEIRKLMYNSI